MLDTLLWPGDPRWGLQARAALATGWPALHLVLPSEAATVAARRVLEQRLGPLPQVDEIEPFDRDDPEEGWELRVDLPGLDAETWTVVATDLVAAGIERFALAPAPSPGAREALDTERIVVDVLRGGGLTASQWVVPETGTLCLPELAVVPPPPGHPELERALALAIAGVRPGLALRSVRGLDTAEAVVHAPTGRCGVRLVLDQAALGALPGDELEQVRQDVLSAVAGVIDAAAVEAPLATDLRWDGRFGLTLLVWHAQPPVPVVRVDGPIDHGVQPTGAALGRLVDGLDGLALDVEVQVVPTGPEHHHAAVEAVVEAARATGVELVGGRPVWVRVVRASPQLVPVWSAPLGQGAALDDLLYQLADHPSVRGVRVVPGPLEGLHDRWTTLDRAWLHAGGLTLGRLRDGASDRDVLALARPRDRTRRDRVFEEAIGRSLMQFPGVPPAPTSTRLVEAVVDSVGREGLELGLQLDPSTASRLPATVAALGAAIDASLASVALLGRLGDRTVVRLWFAERPEIPELRAWS